MARGPVCDEEPAHWPAAWMPPAAAPSAAAAASTWGMTEARVGAAGAGWGYARYACERDGGLGVACGGGGEGVGRGVRELAVRARAAGWADSRSSLRALARQWGAHASEATGCRPPAHRPHMMVLLPSTLEIVVSTSILKGLPGRSPPPLRTGRLPCVQAASPAYRPPEPPRAADQPCGCRWRERHTWRARVLVEGEGCGGVEGRTPVKLGTAHPRGVGTRRAAPSAHSARRRQVGRLRRPRRRARAATVVGRRREPAAAAGRRVADGRRHAHGLSPACPRC
jgi:hypothetical protein